MAPVLDDLALLVAAGMISHQICTREEANPEWIGLQG